MSLSRILLLALIFPVVYGYIGVKCPPGQKSPAFSSNQNAIFNKFKTRFPQALFYKDQTTAPGNDNVFGLAQCKGDISIPDCKSCVATAVTDILKLCTYSKDAVLWYENCFFRFSYSNFFGKINHTNDFNMKSQEDVYTEHSIKVDDFVGKVEELLTTLAPVAARSPSRYAQKSIPYSTQTIYVTAQCTNDLDLANCYVCLMEQIKSLKDVFWEGNVGGRIFGSTCNFRYELYPFYKS